MPVVDQRIDSINENIVDFDGDLSVPISRDAHVVLLALGDERLNFGTGQPVFAMANPIWVDLDGNGIGIPVECFGAHQPAFCRQ